VPELLGRPSRNRKACLDVGIIGREEDSAISFDREHTVADAQMQAVAISFGSVAPIKPPT
ncbi:MAG TPA: hypothetical protein VIK25_06070, partial [Gemmatimonadaceae bacterium]